MVIVLPGEALLNVAHLSLVSGIQTAEDGSGRHFLSLLLMGKHWTNVAGSPEEIQQIYGKLMAALAQVAPE